MPQNMGYGIVQNEKPCYMKANVWRGVYIERTQYILCPIHYGIFTGREVNIEPIAPPRPSAFDQSLSGRMAPSMQSFIEAYLPQRFMEKRTVIEDMYEIERKRERQREAYQWVINEVAVQQVRTAFDEMDNAVKEATPKVRGSFAALERAVQEVRTPEPHVRKVKLRKP